MRVALYGPFRKGLPSNKILDGKKYLGQFTSEPIFNLFHLDNKDEEYNEPCLTKECGRTSVTMDVYDLDLNSIRGLLEPEKGYISKKHSNNEFNKEMISTPFGKAIVFTYAKSTDNLKPIHKGDWKDYKQRISIKDYV